MLPSMSVDPAVLIICGGFALSFLVAGARALVRGRITVVRPASRAATSGLFGLVMHAQRPLLPLDPSYAPHAELTGAQARVRAWLYLALGALFVGLGLFATLVENGVL